MEYSIDYSTRINDSLSINMVDVEKMSSYENRTTLNTNYEDEQL